MNAERAANESRSVVEWVTSDGQVKAMDIVEHEACDNGEDGMIELNATPRGGSPATPVCRCQTPMTPAGTIAGFEGWNCPRCGRQSTFLPTWRDTGVAAADLATDDTAISRCGIAHADPT